MLCNQYADLTIVNIAPKSPNIDRVKIKSGVFIHVVENTKIVRITSHIVVSGSCAMYKNFKLRVNKDAYLRHWYSCLFKLSSRICLRKHKYIFVIYWNGEFISKYRYFPWNTSTRLTHRANVMVTDVLATQRARPLLATLLIQISRNIPGF